MKRQTAVLLSTLMVPGLLGCTTRLLPFDTNSPAQVLSYAGGSPVRDGRARFREILCEVVSARPAPQQFQGDCETFLWRLSDEPQALQAPAALPSHDPRLRIVMVAGAFSECFPDIGLPYPKAAERLKNLGYRIDYAAISGRSSSQSNAARIAEAVDSRELKPGEQLVLIGYSKGTTDILHFLVGYPQLAQKVTAVLSVAGAVNGTPLADSFGKAYARWLAKLPLEHCEPGDEGVVESLKRSVQFPWLANHPLPSEIRYFSLAAFARREDIQPMLLTTYDLLSAVDPRNDSQVIFYDQVIPGSTLLGYANADHWAVAVPIREAFLPRDNLIAGPAAYFRDVLFEAMILFVAESLHASTGSARISSVVATPSQ